MDAGVAGLIGAFLGAAATVVVAYIQNKQTIQNQRDQWFRDKDAKLEEWQRDKLEEIYGNCLNSLSRILRKSGVTAEGKPYISKEHISELFDDYTEAQKWLSLLLIHYSSDYIKPSSGDKDRDFITLKDDIASFSSKDLPDIEKAKELRASIIEMARKDQRLHA
jgi:hypothetical protein